MSGMKGDDARSVIRAADEVLVQNLRRLLKEREKQAHHVHNGLKPWVDNSATFFGGRGKLEAIHALWHAKEWLEENDDFPGNVYYRIEAENLTRACFYGLMVGGDGLHPGSSYWELYLRNGQALNGEIGRVATRFESMIRCCQGEIVRPVIGVPGEVHAPRRARLHEGVSARFLVEDLAEQIETGRALRAKMTHGWTPNRDIEAWTYKTGGVLGRLNAGCSSDIHGLVGTGKICTNPNVPDPAALGRAYLTLGLEYLMEVAQLVPEYVEQTNEVRPGHVSLNFNGGNFYGGQFAGKIQNINSAIAGVVQRGGSDIGEALTALEQAVLNQPGLVDEQRSDLLDHVGYLATAAQAEPEERNRGIIRTVLAALTTAAASGQHLQAAMASWGGVLHQILP